jgi:ketosteroid isomerase-like protein
MIILAVPPTITGEASERFVGAKSRAATIHVDCLDHGRPQLCTRVVEELIAELGRFNEAFNPPDLDRLAAFYHRDAVVFSGGRFFVGRDQIRNELLTPLVANITGATVDISAFRFQVINPNLVIAYGSPSTVITLPGGSTVTLPPLTQSHTWIRQSESGQRRFVLLTDHNGGTERVLTNAGFHGLTSLVQVKVSDGDVHPDCASHPQPRLCNHVVEELTAELDLFNDAFASQDADELAAFFHEDAILFVDNVGRFFRGRNEMSNDFFAPLIDSILNATVDTSVFRYRVIGPNLVVLFGSPTTVVTFKDGSTVTLPPLPQTLTWMRQGDPARPFVILTDHE